VPQVVWLATLKVNHYRGLFHENQTLAFDRGDRRERGANLVEMTLETVLFDFDGTLVHTMPLVREGFQQAVESTGKTYDSANWPL
jgi:hypothetical protein